jgi:hypothetical protein
MILCCAKPFRDENSETDSSRCLGGVLIAWSKQDSFKFRGSYDGIAVDTDFDARRRPRKAWLKCQGQQFQYLGPAVLRRKATTANSLA